LACVADGQLGVSLCEQPCKTPGDCSSLYALCNGATCAPVPCGPAFGTAFDAVCDYVGANDGSCLPFGPSFDFAFDWQTVGLCSQGGSDALGQFCQPEPLRGLDAGSICAAGTICGPNTSGPPPFNQPVDLCVPLCNPVEVGACMGDVGCLALEAAAPLLGFCEAEWDAGTAGCYDGGSRCFTYTDCCGLDCNDGTCQ
jgi:hypothetical protein